VLSSLKLNHNVTIQGEISVGNDIAFWDKQDRQFTPGACLDLTTDSGNDRLYACLNGAHPIIGNNGNFAWNNLQQEVTSWYHKFNDKWHMSTEYWRMSENNTPNVSTPAGQALASSLYGGLNYGAPSGAQCGALAGPTCTSHEWALVNYIAYQFSPTDSMTFRTDILADKTGQRTGFIAKYHEYDLGWQHWIGKAITIRPEIRFDQSIGAEAYDNPNGTLNGGRSTQVMLASDIIFHF